jgi:hypothetical protein
MENGSSLSYLFDQFFMRLFLLLSSDAVSGTQMPLAEVLKERYEALLNGLFGKKQSTPRNHTRTDVKSRSAI